MLPHGADLQRPREAPVEPDLHALEVDAPTVVATLGRSGRGDHLLDWLRQCDHGRLTQDRAEDLQQKLLTFVRGHRVDALTRGFKP